MKIFITTLLIFFLYIGNTYALSVFPGAEGFGVDSNTGGAGEPRGTSTTVYKITTLAKSGSGSLKEAIDAEGPRTVVFEVSGTIVQDGALTIDNPHITIAGQTAPSPGITLRGATITIKTHDVLIQHIRTRVGDDGGVAEGVRDGFTINSDGALDVYDIILDHVSISWALDGAIDTFLNDGTMHDITINNCIIGECLELPGGSKAMIIKTGLTNFSLIGNLFVHNADRNPLVTGGSDSVIVNNVVYNSEFYATVINDSGSSDPINSSVVGCVAIPGTSTGSNSLEYAIRIQAAVPDNSLIYYDDNICNDCVDPCANDDVCVKNSKGASVVSPTKVPTWPSPLTPMAGNVTQASVLANSGARPLDRDSVDIRYINDVTNITGQIINSQDDVGGWPNPATSTRSLIIPANKDADDNSDGYTNLENWLHTFSAGVEIEATTPPPSSGQQIIIITQKERK